MPPDQVTCLPGATSIFRYGLSCMVCGKKGVNDLLNRTLLWIGTSGSTTQVREVTGPRLDLRSTREVYIIPSKISITKLFHNPRRNHHLSYPHRASVTILVQRDVSPKVVSFRDTNSSRIPSGRQMWHKEVTTVTCISVCNRNNFSQCTHMYACNITYFNITVMFPYS